ncbi:hypothetical protein BDV96DRAFT_627972 [Lophiotrema nucula]|uniref:Uncharacterized protein n=1 Tax=Lophiotrema nucula TaxID=690887 RepID=A0A6A5ZPT3_9PLEO|nr:hypothetical protein BDV96DRAFT_627972 [Lophiotrema nucula]
MGQISLQDLQSYARAYFPTEFSELPAPDTLKFENYNHQGTKYLKDLQIVGKRLDIGLMNGKSPRRVRFYGDLADCSLRWNLSQEHILRPLTSDFSRVCSRITHPFSAAVGSKKTQRGHLIVGIDGLDILIKYYFVARGLLPYFKDSHHGLVVFECVVKAVSKRQPLVFASQDNITTLDAQARERMLKIQKASSPTPRSRLVSPRKSFSAINRLNHPESPANSAKTALTHGLDTSEGAVRAQNLAGTKRPAAALNENTSEADESNGRKGAHVSRMRSLFEDREKEMTQTNESLQKVTTERDTLDVQARSLQTNLAQAKQDNDQALKAASEGYASEKAILENQIVVANQKTAKADASVEEMQERLAKEQKLRVDAESKLRTHSGDTAHKLRKACELYAYQKELLEMHTKNEPRVRASLLRDLESEFGIFKNDKEEVA